MADYESTRQRHVAHMSAHLPEHLDRLAWSADRLRAERNLRLRKLLEIARATSPWHRARLSTVDVGAIDENRLRVLPVMTKTDLIAHFDEIVTDRRVTLDLVNAHLASLTSDAYLLDEFHALASGGSSGVRGVFVWGWDAWAIGWLMNLRRQVRDALSDPDPDSRPPVLMIVAADNPAHFTGAQGRTFASPALQVCHFPVTLPLEAIVEGLNRINGRTLMAYASMLATLVAEARAGRLTISPRRIIAVAEPLLPEVRDAVRETWGAPIANSWGTSEGGVVARGCYRDTGMHLADDLLIVEPVDENGEAVPCGSESAKVYVTNLFNPLLPLIRYEITDQVTFLDEPCACGSAHRRIADIQGRLDDVFRYPSGLVVHPHAFRSVLGRDARVIEYQVRQTVRGADVLLRTRGSVEMERLARVLEAELDRVGCPQPLVTVAVVEQIPRVGIGKLKRFVPMEPSAA
jgi:phenylacetate-coenzyme A ligase PaaK-like adenylate-forming protein